jgi:hypothetical protein
MTKRVALAIVLTVLGLAVHAVRAQGGMAQLGLTEAAARTFLFDEVKAQRQLTRRSPIAMAGQRAFYKLPPAARGPAATALFAWAKAYTRSPAFAADYKTYRDGVIPPGPPPTQSPVDQAVAAQIAEVLAGVEQWKKVAATLPPADRAKMLENVAKQEAQARSPEFAAALRAGFAAERGEKAASAEASDKAAADRYPVDPQQLVARRLREFLADTANADFTTRTISLTGGADGIELVDPEARKKPWMWQAAVIVGAEATTAARAAAQAWLAEIER